MSAYHPVSGNKRNSLQDGDSNEDDDIICVTTNPKKKMKMTTKKRKKSDISSYFTQMNIQSPSRTKHRNRSTHNPSSNTFPSPSPLQPHRNHSTHNPSSNTLPSPSHTIPSPSPLQPQHKHLKSKTKHNGRSKRGLYNKNNPHSACYFLMTKTQQNNISKEFPFWKIKDGEDVGHCDICLRGQSGLSMAGDTSIYSWNSSRASMIAHQKKVKHKKAATKLSQLQNNDDLQKIAVYQKHKQEKAAKINDQKFHELLLPLIALAWYIADNQIAIRKFKTLRSQLCKSVVHLMIKIFKDTFNKSILKEMKKMRTTWLSEIHNLRISGKTDTDPVIATLQRVIEDMDGSFKRLQSILNKLEDPEISDYLSNQSQFTELIQCIARVRHRILIKGIQNSPVHTLEFDESTDKSIKSCIIIYVHFIGLGTLHIELFGLFELEGGKALDIVRCLSDIYDKYALPKEKNVGGAMDNCNTMMAKNGVKGKITLYFPNSVLIQGDPDHNVAISAGNSIKNKYNSMIGSILTLNKLTNDIGKYMRKSHKARRIGKAIDSNFKAPTAIQMRWKSQAQHQESSFNAYAVTRCVIPIVAPETTKKTRDKLTASINGLQRYKNAKLLAMESDINNITAILIKSYEVKELQYDDFESILKRMKNKYLSLKTKPGANENAFMNMIENYDQLTTEQIENNFILSLKKIKMQFDPKGNVLSIKHNDQYNDDKKNSDSVQNVDAVQNPIFLRRSVRIREAINPPTNNFVTTNGAIFVCCSGIAADNSAHVQCKNNDHHFEHIECIKKNNKKKKLQVSKIENDPLYKCSLCLKDIITEQTRTRDSDPEYEFMVLSDEEEEEEEEEEKKLTDDNEQHNNSICISPINVKIKNTNIIIYGQSNGIELLLKKIRDNHVDVLVDQLEKKVVLAKNIKKFHFLIPGSMIEYILKIDPTFDRTKYSLKTSEKEMSDYLSSINYGENYIEEINDLFTDIFDKEQLIKEWREHRHYLFYAHCNDIGYKPFWYQYTTNCKWAERNCGLNALVCILIVIALASVNCERGFSDMNGIKTFITNRMRVCLVMDFMLIKNAGWDIGYVINVLSGDIVNEFTTIRSRKGPYKKAPKGSSKMNGKKKKKKISCINI